MDLRVGWMEGSGRRLGPIGGLSSCSQDSPESRGPFRARPGMRMLGGISLHFLVCLPTPAYHPTCTPNLPPQTPPVMCFPSAGRRISGWMESGWVDVCQ